MKELIVSATDAGQRFDKYLLRLMPAAGKSFLYKMLRKKNITLNGKKAEGNELLKSGDQVKVFFADETYEKFAGGSDSTGVRPSDNGNSSKTSVGKKTAAFSEKADKTAGNAQTAGLGKMPEIVFENEHILAINKPVGMLSQKAEIADTSAVEYVADYLSKTGKTEAGFKPSVSNRLDRNTSGILLAGKTIYGQRMLAQMLKERSLEKYYLCIVKGEVKEAGRAEAFLTKDEAKNTVKISNESGEERIITAYRPIANTSMGTLLEVELVTGKSHQIRAQMAYLGHPIAGDSKYGDKDYNSSMRERFGVKHQILHAWRLVFPKMEGPLADISEKEIKTALPKEIDHFCKAFGIKL